ncbi:hypothetical protein E2H86_08805 [Pseudomonas putida]|uniref:hypothetical protein n=1 Tax=Pseudomonas putida TaxID=303 RepID=UPI00105A622C|nr:hypothetical protein [Pseudomonas putida]TDJ77272.1 hypothetical protein E2H86_08805 [Pseudomonas putida]
MDTNKMREQFETWARQRYNWHLQEDARDPEDKTLSSWDGHKYGNRVVEGMWQAWQASREAVVVELPKVVGFEGAYDSHRHHEFVPSMSDVEDADEIFGLCRRVEAKEAIEAQGLKVAP